jgi:hypothetical protein
MPDVPVSDLIWIQDAEDEYQRSRPWLQKQIDASVLTVVTIPGDKRYYLKRSELDRLLRPRELRRGNARDGDGEDGQQSAQ